MSVRLMRPGENSEVVAMMRRLWPEAGEYDFSEERGVHVKDAAFQEMVTSVRQAGRIRRGRLRAGRTIVIRPADVQAAGQARCLSSGVRADDRGERAQPWRCCESRRRIPRPWLRLFSGSAGRPNSACSLRRRMMKPGRSADELVPCSQRREPVNFGE